MSSTNIIVGMIVCCVVLALALVFSKPLKSLIRVVISAILGGVAMFIFNFLLAPVGISVGINLVTLVIVGILGLPGIITLYLASIIL